MCCHHGLLLIGRNLQLHLDSRNIDKVPSTTRNPEIYHNVLVLLCQYGPGTLLLREVQGLLHLALLPLSEINQRQNGKCALWSQAHLQILPIADLLLELQGSRQRPDP